MFCMKYRAAKDLRMRLNFLSLPGTTLPSNCVFLSPPCPLVTQSYAMLTTHPFTPSPIRVPAFVLDPSSARLHMSQPPVPLQPPFQLAAFHAVLPHALNPTGHHLVTVPAHDLCYSARNMRTHHRTFTAPRMSVTNLLSSRPKARREGRSSDAAPPTDATRPVRAACAEACRGRVGGWRTQRRVKCQSTLRKSATAAVLAAALRRSTAGVTRQTTVMQTH